ncbi:MAG: OmpA family protein [Candidatus Nealsonbacteria bacterium]|nr:OmpA family protein [Candidatus Nealsonbacteria bacterium]
MSVRHSCLFLLLAALGAAPGCLFAPRSQLTAVEAHNRVLTEKCRAQEAELSTLMAQQEQLVRAKEELVLLEEQMGMDHRQLADHQRQRAALHEQLQGMAAGNGRLPESVSRQLAALSQRYPSLHFDPVTGAGKLDTDVIFASGETQIKPDADAILRELVGVLNSPDAAALKVMVVGHTDDQRIAGKPTRQRYPNNFHLSTSRALAVVDQLRSHGLEDARIGVGGFGAHEPVAPNLSPRDRQKNRRVEIFVLNRDVPVVGWTESTTTLYR